MQLMGVATVNGIFVSKEMDLANPKKHLQRLVKCLDQKVTNNGICILIMSLSAI